MKVGGRRNFGYGKRLSWAATNALRDRYGDGCYGTRAAHAARWRSFAEFAGRQSVKDARDVTAQLIERFGRSLFLRLPRLGSTYSDPHARERSSSNIATA